MKEFKTDLYLKRLQKNSKFCQILNKTEVHLSFSEEDRLVLEDFDKSIEQFKTYENEILHVFEDQIITQSEVSNLIEKLSIFEDELEKFSRKRDIHKITLNKMINLIKSCEHMFVTVQYLEDIDRRVGGGYDSRKKKGYYLDENLYSESLGYLRSLINTDQMTVSTYKTKLEVFVIQLARLLGNVLQTLTTNVLYIKPTPLMTSIQDISKSIEQNLYKYYNVVRSNYLKEELSNAKDGLKEIAKHKDFQSRQQVKVKKWSGFIKGVEELGKLAEVLRKLD
ncbi:MAG: hypothetical protein ACXAC7_06340 [Candidatus Hodarchaeales archaeon]